MHSSPFELKSPWSPQGDQPSAIQGLTEDLKKGLHNNVLLGVTGSGKTFTMAHVIQNLGRTTLILAPNKTLAAQLYEEMKGFFPENAVEYFVSYYDYYQPEAFVPNRSLYIEKEATINDHIDRLRHSATRALLERKDVIVVASVSCIYGIGAAQAYAEATCSIRKSQPFLRDAVMKKLVELQYKRNDMTLKRGTFRVCGDTLEIFPSHLEDRAWRVTTFDEDIERIIEIDPLTGQQTNDFDKVTVYPNSHYVIPGPTMQQAIKVIKMDLKNRLDEFTKSNKLVEAQRLKERTEFDLESMVTTGTCNGIENYSRYFTGRLPGEPPPTLFEYLPKDALVMIDESHVTIPQLGAMYKGDAARKNNLADYGFRLPSCRDNRPLKFEEWNTMRPQTVFVSATPGPFELSASDGLVHEQVIRPTGLLDPICLVRPTKGQIDDLLVAIKQRIQKNQRTLVTTLTKKMAEDLQEFLTEEGLKSRYIHSDVDTLERIAIIQDLRKGAFDILVGINLLREGLDIPECSLVAIMDADKEGFLRSTTSLIQTIGRAARHQDGHVLLYADTITRSMKQALDETTRRRAKQAIHNQKHSIIPKSAEKNLGLDVDIAYKGQKKSEQENNITLSPEERAKKIKTLTQDMLTAAEDLNFEEAARCRDIIAQLEKETLKL